MVAEDLVGQALLGHAAHKAFKSSMGTMAAVICSASSPQSVALTCLVAGRALVIRCSGMVNLTLVRIEKAVLREVTSC